MNSELILKTEVLDILFETRNKAYGAYHLRKFYNNRLMKSIGIMLFSVVIFSAFTFLPDRGEQEDFEIIEPVFGKILGETKTPRVKPKLIKPANLRPASTLKLNSTIIIVDNKDSADLLKNLDNHIAIGSSTNISLNEAGIQLTGASGDGNEVLPEPPKPVEPAMDINKPMDNAEIMPEFPGGLQALRKYLVRNLNNPRELEAGELISVKVRFVVGYDGKLKSFELVEDGGDEFNGEVMRVLKKMPSWKPGKSKGQNVSVYYIIPVKFIPED